MNSFTQENYLKAIYNINLETGKGASTNAIAEVLETKASSVTDMIKKLADQGLVDYIKYQGTTLTAAGKKTALRVIRKHRLWEVFLVEKLQFKWDEVHEIAEQLEHINSVELTDRLDAFLGNPQFDPHGDPIPDKDGNVIRLDDTRPLTELEVGAHCVIVGVGDSSSAYLKFLEQQQLLLGNELVLEEVFEFDGSIRIRTKQDHVVLLSNKAGLNLIVKRVTENV